LDHRSVAAVVEPVLSRHGGLRRIYVDLPGMGSTGARPELATSSEIIALLDTVVEELIGDEPFAIVGESYGGYLARGLLARRPDQVAGMALLVPVVEPEPAKRELPGPAEARIDDEAMAVLPEAFLAEFRQFIVLESAEVAAGIARYLLPGLLGSDAAFAEELQTSGYRLPDDQLPGVFAGPTLILCGRHDAVVGYSQAVALEPMFPQATTAVLDGAGHIAGLERPAVVRALVEDWARRVWG
jgi:pimeloyl-ACP methyl ester carboxylesterase